MAQKIIGREKIELSAAQQQMVKSGWGEEVLTETTVEKVTYDSDGLKVKGYIAYPKEEGKFPCIIWNRGGYYDNGVIDLFNASGIFGQIASWGYVVFASQYRGNAGGQGKESLGGEDVNDILNLIPLAEEIPKADKNNWGIEGWSRGGMMTFLALAKDHDFKCAVLSGAISSLEKYVEDNPNLKKVYGEMIGKKNLKENLSKRSTINFANTLPKIPYLLMHGGSDETVSPLQSIELAKKFQEKNFNYRLVIFEGGDHFLKSHRKEVDSLRKTWFDRYLKS